MAASLKIAPAVSFESEFILFQISNFLYSTEILILDPVWMVKFSSKLSDVLRFLQILWLELLELALNCSNQLIWGADKFFFSFTFSFLHSYSLDRLLMLGWQTVENSHPSFSKQRWSLSGSFSFALFHHILFVPSDVKLPKSVINLISSISYSIPVTREVQLYCWIGFLK